MPFIHVKSLPFKEQVDTAALVENLAKDFADGTGIAIEHVTATWEYFFPGHYAVAGQTASHQPQNSHPILVDLLAPDFTASEEIAQMLSTVAASIAKHAKVPIGNIFINHRQAHTGMVFDVGEIMRW